MSPHRARASVAPLVPPTNESAIRRPQRTSLSRGRANGPGLYKASRAGGAVAYGQACNQRATGSSDTAASPNLSPTIRTKGCRETGIIQSAKRSWNMPGAPLFDTHIVVDWSARSKPSPTQRTKDSIFWAVAHGGIVDGPPAYATTRNQAVECLTKLVAAEHDAGRRVLLGIDFPFGYPTGVARDLTGRSAAFALWKWLAECVKDDERNSNNRFEVASRINRAYAGAGPCWGRPASWNHPEVPTHKPERGKHAYPPEKRLTEVRASGGEGCVATLWCGICRFPGVARTSRT